jgi:hypothetical protein
METYTLPSAPKPVRFTGTLLASESTETDSALRWLELEIYRIDSGPRTGQYVLHRVGQSLVYHRPETCGYGTSTAWGNVPLDAEPCPVCKPPEWTDTEVWLEAPRHKVVKCPTPVHVEKSLLMRRRDGSTFLSAPALNLIAKARVNDPKLSDYFDEAEEL